MRPRIRESAGSGAAGRPQRPGLPWLAVCLALLALGACGDGGISAGDTALPDTVGTSTGGGNGQTSLIDPAQPHAVAGVDGWMYSHSVETDLDADGVAERVVLTARAEVVRGRPLWDDGQPWQAYVQEADGQRTYLYSRYVQLGSVTIRIGLADGERNPSVLLLEHVPDRLAVYEFEYRGPEQAEVVRRFERLLDPTGDVASPAFP